MCTLRSLRDETRSPRYSVEEIVWVHGVRDCFPDWQALLPLLAAGILGRGESVPERRGEEDAFDAHQGVGEAVGKVAVGEAVGGLEDVLVD